MTIDLVSIKPTGEPEEVGNTQFIMVARKDNRAAPIPGLILNTEEVSDSPHPLSLSLSLTLRPLSLLSASG